MMDPNIGIYTIYMHMSKNKSFRAIDGIVIDEQFSWMKYCMD